MLMAAPLILAVALMLESDAPGGAECMLLLLAEQLRARGHSVCPVGPNIGSGWLAAEFRKKDFVPETYSLRRMLDLGCVRQLAGLLRRRKIDIVHSHEFTMALYGAAASKAARIPQVVTMHSARGQRDHGAAGSRYGGLFDKPPRWLPCPTRRGCS